VFQRVRRGSLHAVVFFVLVVVIVIVIVIIVVIEVVVIEIFIVEVVIVEIVKLLVVEVVVLELFVLQIIILGVIVFGVVLSVAFVLLFGLRCLALFPLAGQERVEGGENLQLPPRCFDFRLQVLQDGAEHHNFLNIEKGA